jgi:hypothetical protein
MRMFNLRFWAVLLLLVLARPPSALAAGDIQVIVNSASSVRDLSRTTLRAIFSMRVRQLPDGTPVTVYVLPDRDERHRAFCKDFLQVYPYVLRDTWDRMVFTGTGLAPIEVGSQEELIRRVAETRGGIGYIAQEGKGSYERIRILEIY